MPPVFRKRSENDQRRRLIDLVSLNIGNISSHDVWRNISNELNTMGSEKKPSQWRKCFSDIKLRARKKIKMLRQRQNEIDDKDLVTNFSHIEVRVVKLLNMLAREVPSDDDDEHSRRSIQDTMPQFEFSSMLVENEPILIKSEDSSSASLPEQQNHINFQNTSFINENILERNENSNDGNYKHNNFNIGFAECPQIEEVNVPEDETNDMDPEPSFSDLLQDSINVQKQNLIELSGIRQSINETNRLIRILIKKMHPEP